MTEKSNGRLALGTRVVGAVVGIVMLTVVLATGWGTLRAEISGLKETVRNLEKSLDEVKRDVKTLLLRDETVVRATEDER